MCMGLGSDVCSSDLCGFSFFFNDTATTEIYTLSLHDALPISGKSLYFVALGDGSGRHKFSDNLRQHNNAVIKYQLKGRKRSFSSYPNKTKKK